MKITFTKRNEKGLHCRFCNAIWWEGILDLYETKPIKGIVCENCLSHLMNYLKKTKSND